MARRVRLIAFVVTTALAMVVAGFAVTANGPLGLDRAVAGWFARDGAWRPLARVVTQWGAGPVVYRLAAVGVMVVGLADLLGAPPGVARVPGRGAPRCGGCCSWSLWVVLVDLQGLTAVAAVFLLPVLVGRQPAQATQVAISGRAASRSDAIG